MTIELGGMNMLLDFRGNPVLYEGDVVAIQCLVSYEDVKRGVREHPWRKPFIITEVNDDGFYAREPFVATYVDGCELDDKLEFKFGTVAIKLLARGGDDAPVSKSEG